MRTYGMGLRTVAVAATLAALATACKSDSTGPAVSPDPGNGTAVNLKGTLANATISGDIDITIAATASGGAAGVTGCVYLKTATCVVTTGSYTVATKGLAFTTTSPALGFSGTYASGVVQGSFTGSGGGFFTTRSGTVSVYCGTFSGAASGNWNFVINGSVLDGVYNDGSDHRLSGTASGNSLAITYSAGTATGTLAGATASGSWTAGAASGSWTGSNVGCRS